MKISKSLNTPKILASTALVGIIVVSVGGGLYLSEKKQKQLKNDEKIENQDVANSDENKNEQKDTNSDNNQNNQTNPDTPTTDNGNTSSKPVDNLTDVTLQGTLDKEDNGVRVSLYGSKGVYIVEKSVNGNWVTVVSNETYIGRGGLDLNDKIPASETQRIYRVYRVTDGNKSGPKQIKIDYNLVVSNGGINNFAGAL